MNSLIIVCWSKGYNNKGWSILKKKSIEINQATFTMATLWIKWSHSGQKVTAKDFIITSLILYLLMLTFS